MTDAKRMTAAREESGYVFFNPDTGYEFSRDHPKRSGECPDAEKIRKATSFEIHLHAELDAVKAERDELERDLHTSGEDRCKWITRARAAEAALAEAREKAKP